MTADACASNAAAFMLAFAGDFVRMQGAQLLFAAALLLATNRAGKTRARPNCAARPAPREFPQRAIPAF